MSPEALTLGVAVLDLLRMLRRENRPPTDAELKAWDDRIKADLAKLNANADEAQARIDAKDKRR